MSTFKDIMKSIKDDIETKGTVEPVSGDATPMDANGMPDPHAAVLGTVISVPGSETVLLNASSFQLMECMSEVRGKEKHRYCIVEKGKKPKYGNQHVNSKGDRTYIVTREVFMLVLSVLKSASKQIKELTKEAKDAKEKAEMYQLTIDSLKKNDII